MTSAQGPRGRALRAQLGGARSRITATTDTRPRPGMTPRPSWPVPDTCWHNRAWRFLPSATLIRAGLPLRWSVAGTGADPMSRPAACGWRHPRPRWFCAVKWGFCAIALVAVVGILRVLADLASRSWSYNCWPTSIRLPSGSANTKPRSPWSASRRPFTMRMPCPIRWSYSSVASVTRR
jgi:hypothetical protein